MNVSTPSPNPNASGGRFLWLHWGLVVALLYVAIFTVLTVPFLIMVFLDESLRAKPNVAWEVYKVGQYWIFIGLLVLSQFLFLRVPVRLGFQRPVSRGSIWLPVIVSGLWLACLVLGALFSISEAFKIGNDSWWWGVFGIPLLSWIVWFVVFLRLSRSRDPERLMKLQTSTLLRGSILELLIAVPSHVVARHRHECCAGLLTFFGLTMGVSVMLLCFRPAVFLLYRAWWRRLMRR
jgi:hypothetical protein